MITITLQIPIMMPKNKFCPLKPEDNVFKYIVSLVLWYCVLHTVLYTQIKLSIANNLQPSPNVTQRNSPTQYIFIPPLSSPMRHPHSPKIMRDTL